MVEEAMLRREPLLARYWRAYRRLDRAGVAAVARDDVPLVQFAIGTGMLSSTPTHHSHMAHSLDTLAAANYVPGNSYSYYNPLAAGHAAAAGGGAAPLRAVAMDSGTWPMDGGGVATCREQVVQGAEDVSWHAEAEVAHDLKQVIIKMRAQPFVTQVNLTIQWDTQHDSPNQSTFSPVPYTQLTRRAYLTTPAAVAGRFLPLWRCLLVGLRKANVMSGGADAAAIGDAVLGLWRYFQAHDWDITWSDPQVSDAFACELRVAAASMPLTSADAAGLGGPEPTMAELDCLFDLFQHYLKTMCLTIPDDAAVIQASHHGLQALAGLAAQMRRNQSLQVWEHGVLMRERLIYLDCFKRNLLPPFVNEQLTRLHRVVGQALYRLSDLVVPCNATFNTAWELWLGTHPARLMPLLNALEIEHYPCLQDNEAPEPTASMLSHVYALKDIMSAIRAAAIIVHDYGVKEYRLEVYGSLDFDRDYVTGCHKLIRQLKLEDNVKLRGLGAPIKVLSATWIYIQTSISEGLPVSVIEAGLTGKCVVCTNVGGCAELLANPNPGASGESHGLEGPQPPMFGRLVAPKDAAMIAYAQLEVLGFLPSLQVPKLLKPPDVDLAELRRRIYDPEVKKQRQALGRLFRQFGLDQFRMSRYILQHRRRLAALTGCTRHCGPQQATK
ncbi:MAG: hypothetical protein J3K34DRAFT_276064 [Monoraphidium minutum]|nr:MAG: hypothetical protein J3K34DRAFT_276064 [Monoraphidium minutum]